MSNNAAYMDGMSNGCAGCFVLVLLMVIGTFGGCMTGDHLCHWYFGDELTEVVKTDPLVTWDWSSKGAMGGAAIGLILTVFFWEACLLPHSDKRDNQITPQ